MEGSKFLSPVEESVRGILCAIDPSVIYNLQGWTPPLIKYRIDPRELEDTGEVMRVPPNYAAINIF